MLRGRAQDKAILNMLTDGVIAINPNINENDLKPVLEQIKTETESILENDKIAGLQ